MEYEVFFFLRFITKDVRLMFGRRRLPDGERGRESCRSKFNTAVDLYDVTVRLSIITALCKFMTASYFIGGYRRNRIYFVHDEVPSCFAALVSKRSRTPFFSLSLILSLCPLLVSPRSVSLARAENTDMTSILNRVKLSIRANRDANIYKIHVP